MLQHMHSTHIEHFYLHSIETVFLVKNYCCKYVRVLSLERLLVVLYVPILCRCNRLLIIWFHARNIQNLSTHCIGFYLALKIVTLAYCILSHLLIHLAQGFLCFSLGAWESCIYNLIFCFSYRFLCGNVYILASFWSKWFVLKVWSKWFVIVDKFFNICVVTFSKYLGILYP